MPTPTPPGQVLPPAPDVVPIPDFITKQKVKLVVKAGEDPVPKVSYGPRKKGGQAVILNALAAIYADAYRRGWTDSAAHYHIDELLK
jgi:hypothetical protein